MSVSQPDAHAPDAPAWRRWGLWVLRALLAAAFAFAGGMKLLAAPDMVAMFDAIGFGQGFRVLTGVLEVSGAAMVLIPATAFPGALLLACIMAGAIATHVALIGGSFVPALVLGLVAAIVAWGTAPRRPDTGSRNPS